MQKRQSVFSPHLHSCAQRRSLMSAARISEGIEHAVLRSKRDCARRLTGRGGDAEVPVFAEEPAPVDYPIAGPYVTLGGGFNLKGSESIKNLSGPRHLAGVKDEVVPA